MHESESLNDKKVEAKKKFSTHDSVMGNDSTCLTRFKSLTSCEKMQISKKGNEVLCDGFVKYIIFTFLS